MPHISEIIVNDRIAALRREAEEEHLARVARAARPHREGIAARLVNGLRQAAGPSRTGNAGGPEPLDRPARPAVFDRPRAAAARSSD